jgi:isobutyryl-CoA mutase small subunit
MAGKIRVVIAKPGLDGHDRGAKIIARALRDAGMEVIYTGLHQTPEQIVETAIQEDADAVGISILSGAHMTLVPRILELLRENGADDVLVVVGGTIPADDAAELKRQGVADVFGPGAPTSDIVDFLRAASAGGQAAAARPENPAAFGGGGAASAGGQAAAARPENPDAFGGGGAASAGGQAAAARPENHAALGGGGGAVPA